MKKVKINPTKATVVALIIYCFVLTWVIMFKCNLLTSDMRFGYRSITFVPFRQFDRIGYLADYLLNIVVYIPMGIYVCNFLKHKSLVFKIAVIAISSIFFEIVQYVIAFGSSDISDVISNTLGGVVGVWLHSKIKNKPVLHWFNCFVAVVGLPLVIFAIIQTVSVFNIYTS
ncbi:MAG: VanZ family protein [Clostridia bacterium]|nr:VanZ family protein [Clostridia bacterium]